MGLKETIRGNVADVYVINSDIASSAGITSDKFAAAAGHTFSGTLISAATSGYISLVTVTSAVSFYFGILQITAAGTSGGISICDSAGTALIEEKPMSSVGTFMNQSAALVARVLEIAAGDSLCALYTTGTATSGFAAKWFAQCITTPT